MTLSIVLCKLLKLCVVSFFFDFVERMLCVVTSHCRSLSLSFVCVKTDVLLSFRLSLLIVKCVHTCVCVHSGILAV